MRKCCSNRFEFIDRSGLNWFRAISDGTRGRPASADRTGGTSVLHRHQFYRVFLVHIAIDRLSFSDEGRNAGTFSHTLEL